MPRTSAALVAGIIEVDPSIDLTPFIVAANELVTEVCGASGYTEERLELIERWLAAHFYAQRDARAQSEKAGSVGADYQSKVDLYLANTHYGQQAMLLDTKGGLASLNRQAALGAMQAKVHWLGRELRATE
jgi:hypothetical protein